MLFILYHLLFIKASDLQIVSTRIKKIDSDINRFEYDISENLNIIQQLKNHLCSESRHMSIKAKIDGEISVLESEKSKIQSADPTLFRENNGKTKEQAIDEIEYKIRQKNAQWETQIKNYNESLSNKIGYEQLNAAHQNKIDSLKSEKEYLQLILERKRISI
ncbi:hypothetical protein EDEG_03408 [Edhazardia aedis USNM 41457]|uniref:Uncharacterized protein n=1 Tax=Edhazardia aedis (strain USNM 41457) TaxID=1003232 RepID=J9DHQ1_EDHAE|nr:hypothetical protein EDEG_03408 [Edhazardia aedis USNM 41457]|eukprot:EJW02140.1 hypothetical protein EDEG_03408 [Edhazardia aedis USNM 41457]